ncbi:hypothetical protein KC887_00700 [Candidatus Kaiserbacteria bacterium]|nr:hypothetical protein [Candidatus Kaiserbacteria bacterium]
MVTQQIKKAFRNVLKKSAAAALSAGEHNNPALTIARMNTCKACPNFNKETLQCGVCGCYMDVKTTLLRNRNPYAMGRVEVTHCPEGRWGDAEIANYYRALDGKEPIKN